MNDLSVDIGYKSLNHYGEYLCGDHVDVVQQEGSDSKVVVLADGLKSGVKASILSTLTSKIISTMMAQGLSLEECVKTIAATLPISSEYGVAYSTFTIMHIIDNEVMNLIQYDNPLVIMIRDYHAVDYPKTETIIDGKKIYRSQIRLQENDIFIAMSDGCPGANATLSYNKNWKEEDIAAFVETLSPIGYTAKTLASILTEECNKLYNGKPIDDTTVCIVRVIRRSQINVIFGPPANPDDCDRMMSLFFSKAGKHIVCGGTTASIAAEYLGKPIRTSAKYNVKGAPPMSEIEGVDLVTEGVVTIDKVLKYAKDYVARDESYIEWSVQHDASALISRMLFEEATDVNFYVGRAVNPAHQDVSINFNVKMSLAEELCQCLRKMGKTVKISYF
jgi:hypothetical protein